MKDTTFAAIPDLHIPKHDKLALSTALEIIKWYKPDEVIILGDFLDCAPVSHWNRKNLREREGMRMADDFKLGNAILDKIQSHTKKITYLKGNHESVRKETELLTIDGWKRADALNFNDYIAQFDPSTLEISYANPLEIVEHFSPTLVEIEGINSKQAVTLNHDVIIKGKKIKANKLLGTNIKEWDINSCGFSEANFTPVDLNILKLLVWTVMDGTVVENKKYSPNSKKIRIQFKLSKQRKIDALKELLTEMNIPFTFKLCKKTGLNKLQPYYIRIYGDAAREIWKLLDGVKNLPRWITKIGKEAALTVVETISITDGRVLPYEIAWTSISSHNIDIIHEMCVRNNIAMNVSPALLGKSAFKNGKAQYRAAIFVNGKTKQNWNVSVKEINYNDLAYCVTMPLGTIITRLDGKVAFTGNCWLDAAVDEQPEFEGLLDLDTGLKLSERGIKIVPYNACHNIGKLWFTHGTYTCQHHAKKHVESFERSIVYGHLHDLQVHVKVNPVDINDKHIGISLGCLAEKNPQFMRNRPNNWVHAVGVGMVRSDGSFNVDPIIISSGVASYAGKTFKGKA